MMPDDAWVRLQTQFEPAQMALGKVLYESSGKQTHVYFPTTAIVSLSSLMADGASADIAIVGNEGIVGIPLFMGGGTTPHRAVVRCAGRGIVCRPI